MIPVGDGEDAADPHLLPGGEWVLFSLRPAGGTSWDQAQIVMQSLATGERIVLVDGGHDARYLPTGHLVYGSNGVLLAVPFDLASRQVTGGAVPLVEGLADAGAFTNAVQFSVAGTGALVYARGLAIAPNTLMWVDRDGLATPLTAEVDDYTHPRLSPDGTQVAVSSTGGVWVFGVERGTRLRLTLEGDHPIWTPDGTRVTFNRGRSLLWRPADGSAEEEELATVDANRGDAARPMSWSPGGETLVFEAGQFVAGTDVLELSPDGAASPLLDTPFVEAGPAFSPDGRWLAYTSNESGRDEVYVQAYPGPGGRWPISPQGGRAPVWSHDGRELFYHIGDAVMAVAVQTDPVFTAGNPQLLFEGTYLADAAGHPRYDVSPDGRRFLMIRPGTPDENAGLVLVQNWFEELRRLVPTN